MLRQAIRLMQKHDDFMNLIIWYRLDRIRAQLFNLSNWKQLPWNKRGNVNDHLKIRVADMISLDSHRNVYLSALSLSPQNLRAQVQHQLSQQLRVPADLTSFQENHPSRLSLSAPRKNWLRSMSYANNIWKHQIKAFVATGGSWPPQHSATLDSDILGAPKCSHPGHCQLTEKVGEITWIRKHRADSVFSN